MEEKNVEFDIIGVSPLSFSKAIISEKKPGEAPDDYEERTWKERLHVAKSDGHKGEIFIPPNALKNMLAATAQFLSESIPGKNKQTYTKNFLAGTMVTEPLYLGIKEGSEAITKERLFVPSDGKVGGSKRVWRNFPTILQWKTQARIYLFDQILIGKPQKVKEYLEYAGQFIGFLRFRPRRGGYYGRFMIKNFKIYGTEQTN